MKNDDAIGQAIDSKGYGTMTRDVQKLFAAAGCNPPRCHANNCAILNGERFRIRDIAIAEFDDADDSDSLTMSLMICLKCDKKNLAIPHLAYETMLRNSSQEKTTMEPIEIECADCGEFFICWRCNGTRQVEHGNVDACCPDCQNDRCPSCKRERAFVAGSEPRD